MTELLKAIGGLAVTIIGLSLIARGVYLHTIDKDVLEAIYYMIFGFGMLIANGKPGA